VQNYIHRLPPAEVIGIDHIYLTVSDLTLSERFYDQVLVEILGFRKSRFVLSNDEHLNYFNRHFGYVLRPRRNSGAFDPYTPGLHHLCFRVASISEVESVATHLRSRGVEATEARLYASINRHSPSKYRVRYRIKPPRSVFNPMNGTPHGSELRRTVCNRLDRLMERP